MYTLVCLNNELQAEYLNSALRRHGLDSFVFKNGVDPDGQDIHSISCLNASELKHARHLIYSCGHFINDIHPEAAIFIRDIRHQNTNVFFAKLISKPALVISFMALSVALLGFILNL